MNISKYVLYYHYTESAWRMYKNYKWLRNLITTHNNGVRDYESSSSIELHL